MCFDWSDSCGDFSLQKLIKFNLTILKKNIFQDKLKTNENAHSQINFAAKSSFNSPNGNPLLSEQLQGNGVRKFCIHIKCVVSQWNVCSYATTLDRLFRILCNIFRIIQHSFHVGSVYSWFLPTFHSYDVISNVKTLNFDLSEAAIGGVL